MGWLVFAVAAAISLLYSCFLVTYRLFFHPLSKYPGPKLAAITNWYVAFYAWRGNVHTKTLEWHEKYGPNLRYGPNTLLFNTHTAMADIYGIRANVRKADGWAAFSASRRSPNILSAIDKPTHRFKRRTLAPVFTDKGLKDMEDRILRKVNEFTTVLGQSSEPMTEKGNWASPKNMENTCGWLAFDVTSDMCYGQGFDMLLSPKLRWIPEVFKKISHRGMMCIFQPKVYEYKIDRLFLASIYKQILAAGTWIHSRAKSRVELGNDIKKKDIFYTLMNAKDTKTGMEYTMKDLWVESMLLLAAGADTTSTVMTAVFYFLLHSPEALSRATDEVRSTFANNDEIRMGPELNSCTFLQACINEALRLMPSVANASPRYVQAGGLIVDGNYTPEGTNIGTSIYTIQRSAAYFDRPNDFWPERWIPGSEGVTEENLKRAQQGFCPFGMGPRSCVGWKLGWMELNVTLARTLFLYDARVAPGTCCAKTPVGEKCNYRILGYAVAVFEGPVAQFRRRDLS